MRMYFENFWNKNILLNGNKFQTFYSSRNSNLFKLDILLYLEIRKTLKSIVEVCASKKIEMGSYGILEVTVKENMFKEGQ